MNKSILNILRQQFVEGDEPAQEVDPEAPAPETEVIEEPPEPTEAEKKIAELEAENARLKATPAPATAPDKPVTSAQLEAYSAAQWEEIEARTGKDKATVLNEYRNWELTNRQNAIDAKTNTSEAIQDAVEANPKLTKLRGAIREFMSEVPLEDQLNPAKLKRAMEKAVIYAKGKHMSATPEPNTPRKPGAPTPSPKGGDEEDTGETLLEGEVKNDTYVSESGLRIKTGKVDPKVWKAIQHKTRDANSVSIPADFDKPPSFNK